MNRKLASATVIIFMLIGLAGSSQPPTGHAITPKVANDIANDATSVSKTPTPTAEALDANPPAVDSFTVQAASTEVEYLRRQLDEAKAIIAEREATIRSLQEQLARHQPNPPPIEPAPTAADLAKPQKVTQAPVTYYSQGSCGSGGCSSGIFSGRRLFGRRR